MNPAPRLALVMRTDDTACRTTAATLRDLGFTVNAFRDEPHLYARTIGLATAAEDAHPHAIIVTEPTATVVRDVEMLRSANWRMPLVLVGAEATAEMCRRLLAAGIPCEQPSAQDLQRAIEDARKAARQ